MRCDMVERQSVDMLHILEFSGLFRIKATKKRNENNQKNEMESHCCVFNAYRLSNSNLTLTSVYVFNPSIGDEDTRE